MNSLVITLNTIITESIKFISHDLSSFSDFGVFFSPSFSLFHFCLLFGLMVSILVPFFFSVWLLSSSLMLFSSLLLVLLFCLFVFWLSYSLLPHNMFFFFFFLRFSVFSLWSSASLRGPSKFLKCLLVKRVCLLIFIFRVDKMNVSFFSLNQWQEMESYPFTIKSDHYFLLLCVTLNGGVTRSCGSALRARVYFLESKRKDIF